MPVVYFSRCVCIVCVKLKINLSNQKFISSNCHIRGMRERERECFSLSMIWNATQLTFSFSSNTNFSFVFCQNYNYTMTCREFTSKTDTSKVQLDSVIQKQAKLVRMMAWLEFCKLTSFALKISYVLFRFGYTGTRMSPRQEKKTILVVKIKSSWKSKKQPPPERLVG